MLVIVCNARQRMHGSQIVQFAVHLSLAKGRHGMVTSTRNDNNKDGQSQTKDSFLRRGRHAAASVGCRLYIYGGLRRDVLLDDFLITKDPIYFDSPMSTFESAYNVTSPRANSLSPF